MKKKFRNHVVIQSLILWLLLFVSASTLADFPWRIIGGNNSDSGEYPWMVSIQDADTDSHICGGSLIHEQYVLTAAHCVANYFDVLGHVGLLISDEFEVVVGGYDLTANDGQRRLVQEIILHPDYNETTLENDIAILKLTESVTTVTPLEMISVASFNNLVAGDELTIMGWGISNDDLLTSSSILQEVILPLTDFSSCQEVYDSAGINLTENMLCAGYTDGSKDICFGDSGSPLVLNVNGSWYQLGIASFNSGLCAVEDFVSVFTRITNYLEFVEDIISNEVLYIGLGLIGKDRVVSYSLTYDNLSDESIIFTEYTLPASISVSSSTCSNQEVSVAGSCVTAFNIQLSNVGISSQQVTIPATGLDNQRLEINFVANILEAALTIDDAVDEPEFAWFSGGGESWQVHSGTRVSGDTSAVSGDIDDIEYSALIAYFTAENASSLELSLKLSSEQSYDFLYLLFNDNLVVKTSGEVDWQSYELTSQVGQNKLLAVYLKDFSISEGEDRSWLDNVVFAETNVAVTTSTEETSETESSASESGGGGAFSLILIIILFVFAFRSVMLVHHRYL